MNNFAITPRLAEFLLKRSTNVIGTIRLYRIGFFKDFSTDVDIQKGTYEVLGSKR